MSLLLTVLILEVFMFVTKTFPLVWLLLFLVELDAMNHLVTLHSCWISVTTWIKNTLEGTITQEVLEHHLFINWVHKLLFSLLDESLHLSKRIKQVHWMIWLFYVDIWVGYVKHTHGKFSIHIGQHFAYKLWIRFLQS